METFKGTPGPWEILRATQPVNNYGYAIRSPSGCVGYWKGHRDWHTDNNWVLTEEDANLIAAAPELLEALQEMVRNGQKQGWNDNYELSMSKSLAAIDKALGETK